MREAKRRICIDFDNTIAMLTEEKGPTPGPPLPGAIAAVNWLYDRNYIIISSCRNSKLFPDDHFISAMGEMDDWLKEHDVRFDEIDNGEVGKVVADIYIDDKGIRFTDWTTVLAAIATLSDTETSDFLRKYT